MIARGFDLAESLRWLRAAARGQRELEDGLKKKTRITLFKTVAIKALPLRCNLNLDAANLVYWHNISASIYTNKLDRLFVCPLWTAEPLNGSGLNLAWSCPFTRGRIGRSNLTQRSLEVAP